MIRPQVTLYEEGLPEDAVRGDHLIVLNKEPLHVQLNQEKDLFIEAAMGQVFVALEDALF